MCASRFSSVSPVLLYANAATFAANAANCHNFLHCPTKWGRYNMFFCDIDLATYFTSRLPDVNPPENEVSAAVNKCSWDQWLNMPSEARNSLHFKLYKLLYMLPCFRR
jgi:hypothetical protein